MSRSAGTWTREQAALMTLRSAQARKERAAAKLLEPPKPQPVPELEPARDYEARRLHRTRAQLEILASLIDREMARRHPDPAKLDKFASALERLEEVERKMAGRPLPGSLKPGSAPSSATRPVMPIISAPTPIAPQPGSPAPAPSAITPAPPPPRFPREGKESLI
jgi:hypothetical protein